MPLKRIADRVDRKKLIGFIRSLAPQDDYLWPTLFPFDSTDDLKAKYLKGSNRKPVVMNPVAFESESPLGVRTGALDEYELEIPQFKRKLRQDEETVRKALQPRQDTGDADAVTSQIYNDAENLYDDLDATREYMCTQAISTGKVVLETVECDFLVPADQIITLAGGARWDQAATRNVLQNELDWLNKMSDNGRSTPARALMSRKARNFMLVDNAYRIAYWGRPFAEGTTPPQLTWEQVQQVRTAHGLPPVRVYDRKVTLLNANGTTSEVRLMDDSKVAYLPAQALGNMLHGVPTEAMVDKYLEGSERKGVYTYVTVDDDPVNIWTKIAALVFPTFPEADNILIADVF
jgi:hypothetical protein